MPIVLPAVEESQGAGSQELALPGSGLAVTGGVESYYIYNGLILNDRSLVDTYIVKEIGGLDDADVRDSRELFPQSHGEHVFDSWYGGRTITLSGTIRAHNIGKLRDMQEALKLSFNSFEESSLRILSPYYTKPKQITLTNLVANPSSETTATVTNFSASTSGDPAATAAITTAWRKVGTNASRYTVVRDDGVAVVARTATGTSGIPVTAGASYGFRVYVVPRVFANGRNLFPRIYWYTAAGATSAVNAVSDGPEITTPVVGDEYELYLVAQAPSDAAFASVGVIGGVGTVVANETVQWDSDAYQFHLLDSLYITGYDAASDSDDIPSYFDGSFAGARWTGTAHNSTSQMTSASTTEFERPEVEIMCRKSQPIQMRELQQNFQFTRDFLITLRAPKPIFTSTVSNTISGPVTSPYQTSMNNSGNFNAEPTFVLGGPMTNPIIQNSTTGQTITITGVIAAGQTWTLDTSAKTFVDQTGANKFSTLDVTSEWIELEPGINDIVITFSAGTGATTASLNWKDAWI